MINSGSLLIDNSDIIVTGQGYSQGPGYERTSGGSFGGQGGNCEKSLPLTYGNFMSEDVLFGSGGGGEGCSLSGGGAIMIYVK